MSQFKSPLTITGVLKSFPWGKTAKESVIPFLMPGIKVPDEVPCAELWIGSHHLGEASVKGGKKISEIFSQAPYHFLGSKVVDKFSASLPFLFKVLSIAKPLSIQAHPDLPTAKMLHARDPEHYPDTNHKPEIAIALTEMKLLAGFRPWEEISADLSKHQSLQSLLTKADSAEIPQREFIRLLVELTPQERAALFAPIRAHLSLSDSLGEHDVLALNLEGLYGAGDLGILFSYLLNLIRLEPGQALFTPPNMPHSYLSGTLIECMATSDNVVRAGLTDKFVDAKTLLEILDFKPLRPSVVKQVELSEGHTRYNLPVEEFFVEEIDSGDPAEIALQPQSVELLFCLRGEGLVETLDGAVEFKRGTALLIPAETRSYRIRLGKGRLFRIGVP